MSDEELDRDENTKHTNPLGQSISFHKRTYHGHIEKRHQNVSQDQIKDALENPDEIWKDGDAELHSKSRGEGHRNPLLVVVCGIAYGLGWIVKTAFPSKKVKGDEKLYP